MGLHRATPVRAKPPGCFFVGAVERAAVHPGGHAVELLPHLRVGDDDDDDDDDDDGDDDDDDDDDDQTRKK